MKKVFFNHKEGCLFEREEKIHNWAKEKSFFFFFPAFGAKGLIVLYIVGNRGGER